MKTLYSLIIILITINVSFAKGPANVAVVNSLLWPKSINSSLEFDRASRAEILIFLKTIDEQFPSTTLVKDLRLKENRIDQESIKKWVELTKKKLLKLYNIAKTSCKSDEDIACGFKGDKVLNFTLYANTFASSLAEEYQPWLKQSESFHKTYAREQIRLAALYPKPTSEIFTLSNDEITGDNMKDGEFIFTMDDGPDFKKTKKYSELLTENKMPTIFFALGEKLKKSIEKHGKEETKNLYSGHCLASHGMKHKSHQRWKEWKSSLTNTDSIIKGLVGDSYKIYFRPPYGQRTKEVLSHLKSLGSVNMLWNIDSNDWHSKISKDQIMGRISKLMLLWRKGIILFHDVHNKAFESIPRLAKFAKQNNLKWIDCSKDSAKIK